MTIEELYALITVCGMLNSQLRRAGLEQFDSGSPIVLLAQIKEVAKSGGFLEIE